jgi:hypothetical protein
MEVLLILVILVHKFSNRNMVIFDQLLPWYGYYSCSGCRSNCFDYFVPAGLVTFRNRYLDVVIRVACLGGHIVFEFGNALLYVVELFSVFILF